MKLIDFTLSELTVVRPQTLTEHIVESIALCGYKEHVESQFIPGDRALIPDRPHGH